MYHSKSKRFFVDFYLIFKSINKIEAILFLIFKCVMKIEAIFLILNCDPEIETVFGLILDDFAPISFRFIFYLFSFFPILFLFLCFPGILLLLAYEFHKLRV